MGVQLAEKSLLDRAILYAQDVGPENRQGLLQAALQYASEKRTAANKRDRWKQKRRMKNGS